MIVVIIAGLTACGGGGSDTTYTISGVEAMGQTITVEDFQTMAGMDVSGMEITIKSNGKFTIKGYDMNGGDESEEGTWKEIDNGYTLTIDGSDQDVTFQNDKKDLVMDMGVAKIIFTKK